MKTSVRKYNQWLREFKSNIYQNRLQTALKVNNDMLILYWYNGKQIAKKNGSRKMRNKSTRIVFR